MGWNRHSLLSLFVALVYAVAAMPGSMGATFPEPSNLAKQIGAAISMPMAHHCADMAPAKQAPKPASPCKSLAGCMGLLGCCPAALPAYALHLKAAPPHKTALALGQSVAGLTIPPDDRPPIG